MDDTTRTPKDFIGVPMKSVLRKYEAEIVARNIMIILERTGNIFRGIEWNEYEKERKKDGNFTSTEAFYFNQVLPY